LAITAINYNTTLISIKKTALVRIVMATASAARRVAIQASQCHKLDATPLTGARNDDARNASK
jgi:hypothetical protein